MGDVIKFGHSLPTDLAPLGLDPSSWPPVEDSITVQTLKDLRDQIRTMAEGDRLRLQWFERTEKTLTALLGDDDTGGTAA